MEDYFHYMKGDKRAPMTDPHQIPPWIQALSEEDWHFIRRFILASGSLKEVARQYGISYPTVRIRLNRLIEKIRALEESKADSPFHQAVKLLVAEGKLDVTVARTLIRAFNQSETGEDP